jgi:hypothetical protein
MYHCIELEQLIALDNMVSSHRKVCVEGFTTRSGINSPSYIMRSREYKKNNQKIDFDDGTKQVIGLVVLWQDLKTTSHSNL